MHAALIVGFENSEYRVSERDGTVEVCVLLTGHYQRAVHALLSTEPNTATGDTSHTKTDAQDYDMH